MKTRYLSLLGAFVASVACLSSCNDKSYYASIDFENDYGAALVEKLHALMWSTHVYQVKYGRFSSYQRASADFDSIDQIPDKKRNESFYTGVSVSFGTGNREHVWAAANSDGLWNHDNSLTESHIGGGSDLYHVRPCNSYLNTARGNALFVDFDDYPELATNTVEIAYTDGGAQGKAAPMLCYPDNETKYNYGKYQYADYCEVADSMKGDVARILAYVWLHYQRNSATPENEKSKTGRLAFKNVLYYGTEEECRQKLVEWNESDPVSAVELHRNDTVQKIQGNRNPFVDHPECMAACFEL